MFKLKKVKQNSVEKFKVALNVIKEELGIIKFSAKYKISHKEAKEFKKWCLEAYYFKSYKSPEYHNL